MAFIRGSHWWRKLLTAGSLAPVRAPYSAAHLQAGEVAARDMTTWRKPGDLIASLLLPVRITTSMVPCLPWSHMDQPRYQWLPSLASSMIFGKFLNVSAVPLQQLSKTVVAPTTMCPTELTCKELHGRLKPLVLRWPDLLFRVAVLFPAFSWVVDTGSTLPFSLCSHIWIWVGTSGSE